MCAIEKSSVIEEELKMCGYFCIIASENMKAKKVLELYKSRDASEKLFKVDKAFLRNRSMIVYTGKDEEEKLLSSPNFMNVPAAIRELEICERGRSDRMKNESKKRILA